MNQSPKVKDLQAVMDAKSQVMEAQAWIGEIEARILGEEEDVSREEAKEEGSPEVENMKSQKV